MYLFWVSRTQWQWNCYFHVTCGVKTVISPSGAAEIGVEVKAVKMWRSKKFSQTMVIASEPKYFKHHWKELWKNTVLFLTTSLKGSRKKTVFLRSGKKNGEKKRPGCPLWGGGSPPSSLTASILWKFWPILSIIKWQNNPKYDNLSRNFYIFLTASGEGGGSTQAVSLTAFFPFFFWWLPKGNAYSRS